MNLPAKIIPLKREPTFPHDKEAERRYRQACFDFLDAAFNGASRKHLWHFSNEMFVRRKKMLGQGPLGNPTGDQSLAGGTSKP